jgi:acetyltransferase
MGAVEELRHFLEPRSIALVGVSRHTGDGTNVLENLIAYGYQGKVYPVNPNAQEILGVRCYASIKEVPGEVDMAVLSTPRQVTPEVVEECVGRGIKAIVVVGQGFADAGEEGRALQEEVVRIARRGGARLLGPNTFGVGNAFIDLNTAFVPFVLERVPIGTIANSGILFAGAPRLRLMGKAIDLGNGCDLDFADGLEYFEQDPDIKLIVLFMERVKDGRRFLEVARQVSRKKPVIVLKPGRTPEGARMAQSHTGALAGEDRVYEAAFRQAGLLRAGDFDELHDLILTLWRFPPLRGRRLGVATVPMGAGVIAMDAIAMSGMELAPLTPETRSYLTTLMPDWLKGANPVDLGPTSFTSLGMQEATHRSLEALMRDPTVDAVLLITPVAAGNVYDLAHIVAGVADTYPEKPLALWLYVPDPQGMETERYMQGGRVVAYPTVERAIRSLRHLADFYSGR